MHSELHTDQFDYNGQTRTFTAEASELGMKPGFVPTELVLKSGRTGNKAHFVLEFINEDGTLEFTAWNPTLKALNVGIKIFND